MIYAHLENKEVEKDPSKKVQYLAIRKITIYSEGFAIPCLILYQIYMYYKLKKMKQIIREKSLKKIDANDKEF